MATDSRSQPTNSVTTDALFRAWGKAISDSLRAGGCTATSDTGQIDFTTVARPSLGSFAGYELYRLTTDSKLSDLGLYIKIEYGISNGNTGYVSLAVTVGTGTNGSGTLTGVVGTRRVFDAYATSSSGTTYTCAGDGRLIICAHWTTAASSASSWVFIVERLRDNTGAITADGIYTFLAGPTSTSQNNAFTEVITSAGTSTGMVSNKFGAWVNNATANYVSDFYMATHHPADRNTLYNPILSNLFYYHTDLTTGTNITASRYGTNRTYKPIGQLPTAGTSNYQNTQFGHTNAGMAIIWE